MRNRTPQELQAKLPKLKPDNYRHTSNATGRYNCVAFANDTDRKWWQAGLHGGLYHWPSDIPDTLEGWTELFTRQGYELTEDRNIEAGFEKIAIYVDLEDMAPGHVAKSDGIAWKSKLGRYQDIEHASLDLLEGDHHWEYGIVERILRRPISKKARKVRVRKVTS